MPKLTVKRLQRLVQRALEEERLAETFEPQQKRKKLLEAAAVGKKDQHLSLHDKKRLGAAAKQYEGPELSDVWYSELAKRFMQDYGGNIEDSWEEITVRRYCSSVKATSGVDVDEKKLFDAIKKLINDREERVLKRTALKETLEWLNKRSESIDEVVYHEPKRQVVDESLSSKDIIKDANKLFKIQYKNASFESYNDRLDESITTTAMIPTVGRLPQGDFLSINDEKSLDSYCNAWNSKQSFYSDSLKVGWSIHPHKPGIVLFKVSKR